MKKIIFLLILSFLFSFAGCGQKVGSFTEFSIHGFESFYDFHTTVDIKESYIREGKIDFAKISYLYVCPFIKEINYDEIALFFYIYALEDGNIKTVTISDVVLSSEKDDAIIYNSSNNQSVVLGNMDEYLLLGKISDMTFKKSDEWFFNDNTLNLSFKVSVDADDIDDKIFSYRVRIICNKRAQMPT